MRPHYNVVIVGAGASGISLLNKIVETLPEGLSTKGITIAIVDSGPECGGRAYPPDSVSNLMNTKCGAIDRGFGGGYGFLQWAAHNESKWRPLMGGDEIGEDSYVPRPVVGLYLAGLKERAIRLGRQRGFVIDSIDDDVHDISVSGEHYAIKTKGGKLCDARYVYLALGHLERKQTHSYQSHERCYNQPYPIRRLQEEIPKDARVGVIGTRLSAIDVTLGLASAGHTGSVTCISRSGRLPAVRAERGSYRFQEIEPEDLVKLLSKSEEKLRLTDIVNMLNREIAFAEGRDLGLAEIMRNDLPPIDYYRNEIALSKGRMRPWQSVLYATNRNIDLLWHYLEEDDKQLMMSEWLNDWLTYRASIPRENAERMLALMESGLVAVEGGARGIRYNADSAMFEMLNSQQGSDLQGLSGFRYRFCKSPGRCQQHTDGQPVGERHGRPSPLRRHRLPVPFWPDGASRQPISGRRPGSDVRHWTTDERRVFLYNRAGDHRAPGGAASWRAGAVAGHRLVGGGADRGVGRCATGVRQLAQDAWRNRSPGQCGSGQCG